MIFKHLLSILGFALIANSAGATLNEPGKSAMASGHWVKIRVYDDAIYQLTYNELRNLGFESPERVNVFGYNPTLLLTHDDSKIPADVSLIHTMHCSEYGKLLFFGKGDTDYAPELWNESPTDSYFQHSRHTYSNGATYFLSDVDVTQTELSVIDAPESVSESILTEHTALVYHEDDSTNPVEGGIWFGGTTLSTVRPSETIEFEVARTTGNATMVYGSLLSPENKSNFNYLLAEYSDGITSEAAKGLSANALDGHQVFRNALNFQHLNIPVAEDARKYSVTFKLHPQAANMTGHYMLDFFGLLYKRSNNLSGMNQAMMYFENSDAAKCFALTGIEEGDWHVWDVNMPLQPVVYGMLTEDKQAYGQLAKASKTSPNQVIAFNSSATQPTPEIVGIIDNQNLHALQVPDMVIVTSKLYRQSAEKIAALHNRLQGLDVAVIDQQDIFNEYSSGNISPEGVRRFLSHLYSKAPEKLKGLLLLGPGTYNSAKMINDNMPYVINAEAEAYILCSAVTKAFASDTFFGRFGNRITTGNWLSRGSQMQICAGDINIAVGRVPFMSANEIDSYYAKVEEYLTNIVSYPATGNIILASDYSSSSEEHHLSNAEALVPHFGDKANTTITINRAGYNLSPGKMPLSIVNTNLKRGASLFAYFGHGNPMNIAGSDKDRSYLMNLQSAEKLSNIGKYPIFFIGSCNVAPYNRNHKNLTNALLATRYGGPIAVIASGREVFQKQNQLLGEYLVNELMNARNGEWMGRIWCNAQQATVQIPQSTRDNIVNHLTYNYFGDPAIPYYGETHYVTLETPTGNLLTMNSSATISGSVINDVGAIDADFNGFVKLTVYEVPEVKTNILGSNGGSNLYYEQVTCDQEVIGQFDGEVRNGKFDVTFIVPATVKSGVHRIQAYAYSNDGKYRGLGCLSDVSFNDNADDISKPAKDATVIRSFAVRGGEGIIAGDEAVLVAEVYMPSGMATANSLKSAVTLTVDGNVSTHLENSTRIQEKDVYVVEYALRNLSFGKHSASLSILDGNGDWCDASLDFIIDNSPAATLSASVDEDGVNFEIATSIGSDASKLLLVERLNGEMAVSKPMTDRSETISLPAGAYRAYVQLSGKNVVTSTPKIEIIVE